MLVKLCEELNALCAKFWWRQVGNERKVHWKSWGSLTQPKANGGMGFRDLRLFNHAMFAKQGWRLMHDQNSLFFKCFKARYFPRCHFFDAAVSPNSSFVWRSIMSAMPILRSRSCWRVGNGESIEVLLDKWIPNYPTNKVLHSVHEVRRIGGFQILLIQNYMGGGEISSWKDLIGRMRRQSVKFH